MRKLVFLAVLLSALVLCPPASCESFRFDSIQRGQREVGLFVGHGLSHRLPASTKVDISGVVAKVEYGRYASSHSQYGYELSAWQMQGQPHGLTLIALLRYRHHLLASGANSLGFDFGMGLAQLGSKVHGMATKGNFAEQAGLTFQHATGKTTALTLEYRYCHISNAGIKTPNVGINSSVFALGYTWFK